MDDGVRVKVMVVENDPEVSHAIARSLTELHDLELTSDPAAVLARLAAGTADWDVMLLDADQPGPSTVDVLNRFREAGSPVTTVVLGGETLPAVAAEHRAAGAYACLLRPFRMFDLASLVDSAARCALLRRRLHGRSGEIDDAADAMLIGLSDSICRLRAALGRLASQDLAVLIHGERGTGKELVARTLHARGARRAHRFVALDCGAIPEAVIDSELFGHTRGAFPGATADRPGVFVEADGGTLFLGEIGEMPLATQARLLRVLEEGRVQPLGGSSARPVDVRVIAATHVDLGAAVEDGRFDRELYRRLGVVRLAVPPLRERLDDLLLLADHFLRKHGRVARPRLLPEALELLRDHTWPGNVRELENVIMQALSLHHGGVIGPESLPPQLTSRGRGAAPYELAGDEDVLLPLTEAKRRASSAYERAYLHKVMEKAKGSVSQAARLAGIDRTNFRRVLQRHSIDPAGYK
jgi:two-component system, NtrC family, response regulator HydG